MACPRQTNPMPQDMLVPICPLWWKIQAIDILATFIN